MSSLEQLRQMRIRAGLSRNALSDMIGVSHTFVWNVESGKRRLTARDTIAAWARALDVEPDDVYRAIDQVPHDILDELLKADPDTWALVRKLTRQFNEADEK